MYMKILINGNIRILINSSLIDRFRLTDIYTWSLIRKGLRGIKYFHRFLAALKFILVLFYFELWLVYEKKNIVMWELILFIYNIKLL